MVTDVQGRTLSANIAKLKLTYAYWVPKTWVQVQKRKVLDKIIEKVIEIHFIRVPPSEIRVSTNNPL